jgi:hypothetical protein
MFTPKLFVAHEPFAVQFISIQPVVPDQIALSQASLTLAFALFGNANKMTAQKTAA